MELATAKTETQLNLTNFLTASLLLFAVPLLSFVITFLSYEHDIDINLYDKKNDELHNPFDGDVNYCMEETGATLKEVRNFLEKMPLHTHQGKCFVACILQKSDLISNDKIDEGKYLKMNEEIYGEESEITHLLKTAMNNCLKAVKDVFEACEYAAIFNDCMAPRTQEIMRRVDEELHAELMRQIASQSNGHVDAKVEY